VVTTTSALRKWMRIHVLRDGPGRRTITIALQLTVPAAGNAYTVDPELTTPGKETQ